MNIHSIYFALIISLAGPVVRLQAADERALPISPSQQNENLRAIAETIRGELRLIDSFVDQWAIEHNKKAGAQATVKDLIPYVKRGSRLHAEFLSGRCTDSLGHSIAIPVVDALPRLPRDTFNRLSTVAPEAFWQPYSIEK